MRAVELALMFGSKICFEVVYVFDILQSIDEINCYNSLA